MKTQNIQSIGNNKAHFKARGIDKQIVETIPDAVALLNEKLSYSLNDMFKTEGSGASNCLSHEGFLKINDLLTNIVVYPSLKEEQTLTQKIHNSKKPSPKNALERYVISLITKGEKNKISLPELLTFRIANSGIDKGIVDINKQIKALQAELNHLENVGGNLIRNLELGNEKG